MIGHLLTAWWDPRGARTYVGRHRAGRHTRYVGQVRVRGQRSGTGHTTDRRDADTVHTAAGRSAAD